MEILSLEGPDPSFHCKEQLAHLCELNGIFGQSIVVAMHPDIVSHEFCDLFQFMLLKVQQLAQSGNMLPQLC